MTTATTLHWLVAPADPETLWADCRARWLSVLEARSGHPETRRAYQRDVEDFLAQSGLPFGAVTKSHVWDWIDAMRRRGLADATINRRLAALSSLYRFAHDEYRIIVDGQERPLWPDANPFAGRSLRLRIEPYAHSVFMSTDECRALFAAIDDNTPTGLRNLCILFGMFATTRRISEWIGIRLSDIHHDGETTWFSYRYKGGKPARQVIPPALWDLLDRHIAALHPAPDGYLFVATTDVAQRFAGRNCATTTPEYDPASHHLSASYVNKLLRQYGIPLGIAPERLHGHSLRHAGSRFRQDHGASLEHLKDTLGHRHITTTQIYAGRVLDVPVDEFGGIVGDILPKHLAGSTPHKTRYHNTRPGARFGVQPGTNRA